MHLRILVVEPNSEDALFLREVLADIELERRWDRWIPIQAIHAAGWEDANELLASEPVDIVLLSLDTDDADSFHRVQDAAPYIPIVLLIDSADPSLALRLLREGAQDFLTKAQVDSAQLAHAIRNSVERHRVLAAARAASSLDFLTSLPNRTALLQHAERDRKLAERLGRRWMLLLAEPKNLDALTETYGDERRKLSLIEAADHLRSLMGPTDLLGRLEEARFAVGVFDTGVVSIESAWARLHEACRAHHLHLGAAIFDPERPTSLDALLGQAAADLHPSLATHAAVT